MLHCMAPVGASSVEHTFLSPGFASRFAVALIVELAAWRVSARLFPDALAAAHDAVLGAAEHVEWWSAVSLLASACCAVQVAASALALGCTGANAALGPSRPHVLAAAALAQAAALRSALHPPVFVRRLSKIVLVSLVSAALALLPEAIALLERLRVARAAAREGETTLEVRLHNAKCVACARAVRLALEGAPGVSSVSVDLDLGVANVTGDASASKLDLEERVRKAGYGAPASEKGSASGCLTGAVVGGLCGSSCCALQLALTAVGSGFGCAGFNKVLGPLRPLSRTVTAAYLVAMWVRAPPCARARRRLALATAVALALTLLPEALLWSGGPALAAPMDRSVTRMTVSVGGMGCEACSVAVRNALARVSGVVAVRPDLEGGSAELLVNTQWGFGGLGDVSAALAREGYELLG